MDEIIEVFHIDAKLLIAQVVNFTIVFAVLYLFAVKPIMKIMKERTTEIEKGLENAASFDAKITALQNEREEVILKAKNEAKEIVMQAKVLSEEHNKQAAQKTKDDVANIILQAKTEVADMKDKMVDDIKKESIGLIVTAATKVLGRHVDKKVDEKLVENYLKEVK